MLLTTSPRTRVPQHSTGWRAMRLISDRAGKYNPAGPADWIRAKHREVTLPEAALMVQHRLQAIHQAAQLHSK